MQKILFSFGIKTAKKKVACVCFDVINFDVDRPLLRFTDKN